VQLTITGRHTELPEHLKEYISEKSQKLPRFFNGITSIEVIIDGDQPGSNVEMIVTASPHQTFVVHESGDNLRASVDLALNKMERQLRRHKERLKSHKHSE